MTTTKKEKTNKNITAQTPVEQVKVPVHAKPMDGHVEIKKPKVTRKDNLAEVIFKYPQAAEVLTDYGLHCVGCFASSFDTINDASVIHSMSDEEIDEMVERVNEVLENGE